MEVTRKQRKDEKNGAERIKQYKVNEKTPLSTFMQLQVCVFTLGLHMTGHAAGGVRPARYLFSS